MPTILDLLGKHAKTVGFAASYRMNDTRPRVPVRGKPLPPIGAAPPLLNIGLPPADPYDVLGVPRTASQFSIQRAYRRQMRIYHPDLHPEAGPLEHAMLTRWAVALNAAYDKLIDAVR